MIGKNGASIKKIIDDTGCGVIVSNMTDLPPQVSLHKCGILYDGIL